MCFMSKPKVAAPVIPPPTPPVAEVKDQTTAAPSEATRRKRVGVAELRMDPNVRSQAVRSGGINLPTM
jgi:hypothetical protein